MVEVKNKSEDDIIEEWINEHPILSKLYASKTNSYEELKEIITEHISKEGSK